MFDRVQIKEKSKEQIRGQWFNLSVPYMLYSLAIGFVSGLGTSILGKRFEFIFMILMYLGVFIGAKALISLFLRVGKGERVNFGTYFEELMNFNGLGKYIGLLITEYIIVLVGCLLFIIPGIIWGYSYCLAPMIMIDNPNKTIRECLDESKQLMSGNKMALFVLMLSFIGWAILSQFTFGILTLWVFPYMMTSYTNMYLELKSQQIQVA